MSKTVIRLASAAALALCAAPALAHVEGAAGHVHGMAQGFVHPFLGLDHLAAMLAVGLWSGLALPGRVWAGPAAFMGAMALGAVIGMAGVAAPLVEPMILASAAVLGLMILAAGRIGSGVAGLGVVGLLALAHGHAHGAEATGGATGWMLGMLAATAALHGLGLLGAASVASRPWIRAALGGAGVLASLALSMG